MPDSDYIDITYIQFYGLTPVPTKDPKLIFVRRYRVSHATVTTRGALSNQAVYCTACSPSPHETALEPFPIGILAAGPAPDWVV
ncbi:hypothetical protein E4T56_gene6173 [Termitomyces sp. T112]|nr:hypothetical protein E4T56_gene6173 [Termitomyces sp. T112]